MLKLKTYILMTIFLIALPSYASSAPLDKASDLKNYIASASVVHLYYYTKTDQLNLTNSEFRSGATVEVILKCGHSCGYMLRQLISHFEISKEMANCPTDQKYLLIDFGKKKHILYYVGGRISKLNGHCYYNDQNISDVLHFPD